MKPANTETSQLPERKQTDTTDSKKDFTDQRTYQQFHIQEKIDRSLGYQLPVCLDDIIVVTRGSKEENTEKLENVLKKLEDEGYRASRK